jgi:hypothetical protein
VQTKGGVRELKGRQLPPTFWTRQGRYGGGRRGWTIFLCFKVHFVSSGGVLEKFLQILPIGSVSLPTLPPLLLLLSGSPYHYMGFAGGEVYTSIKVAPNEPSLPPQTKIPHCEMTSRNVALS